MSAATSTPDSNAPGTPNSLGADLPPARPGPSLGRRILKFTGSLQLAMILLLVLIVASIQGTILESQFNADVARKYIYSAQWFDLWMLVLCINLFCVTLTRWPWKKHHYPFVITHYGIIVLLFGGFIDKHWGIEGFVQLDRHRPPTDIMQLHAQNVCVGIGNTDKVVTTPLKLKELITPKDLKFGISTGDPGVTIEPLDIYAPAVQVTLNSPMMGRHDVWLFLNGIPMNAGPASISFEYGLPPVPREVKKVPSQESFLVFTKNPELNMRHLFFGDATRANPVLTAEGDKAELKLTAFGREYAFPVKENIGKDVALEGSAGWSLRIDDYFPDFYLDGGKPITRSDKPNNPALKFVLTGPMVPETHRPLEDHEDGAAPMMHRMDPNANLLSLHMGEDGTLRYFLRSRKTGEFGGEIKPGDSIPTGWAPGSVFSVTQFIPEGFSQRLSDFRKEQAAFHAKTPDAHFVSDFTPPSPRVLEERRAGLLLRVSANGESRNIWVTQSPSHIPFYESVTVGGKRVHIGIADQYVLLPFKVALERFYAPFQPGMEGNRSFMAFESTLAFQDKPDGSAMTPQGLKQDTVVLNPKSEHLGKLIRELDERGLPRLQGQDENVFLCAVNRFKKGQLTLDFTGRSMTRNQAVYFTYELPESEVQRVEKHTRKISMNRPTTYPDSVFGPFTGTTYKLSQAGHNMPADPHYSGVQVLRDPGWLPKWVGSLMMSIGIFMMFYMKPYWGGRKTVPAAAGLTAEQKKEAKRAEKEARRQQKKEVAAS